MRPAAVSPALVLLLLLALMSSSRVSADFNITATQCRANMKENWFSPSFKQWTLTTDEFQYLQAVADSSDVEERADAPLGRRQECRTLSDAKRQRLFDAFKWMFTNRVNPDGLTRYQVFMSQHRFSQAPGAHFGPCFPCWHRNYLYIFERALQEYDSSVFLCYWDSTLDSLLPDASDSCLWTAEYFGNGNGFVTSGFAANLQPFPSDCATKWSSLFRSIGGNQLLLTKEKISKTVLQYKSFNQMVSPYRDNDFEAYHGGIHGFVGGQMSQISCSVSDPIFFFHHTFIDYLFELFRRRQKNRQEYPTSGIVPMFHRANDMMLPFNNRCIEGLSDVFVQNFYDYDPSPDFCSSHEDCGSKALWCYNGRCTACVGPNKPMGLDWPNAACYIAECAQPMNVNQVCRCVL